MTAGSDEVGPQWPSESHKRFQVGGRVRHKHTKQAGWIVAHDDSFRCSTDWTHVAYYVVRWDDARRDQRQLAETLLEAETVRE
jgi:hypothetical protein